MSDSALPFRPRLLTPVDRALASIETQTSKGRRRLNRRSLEHAFFVAAGAVLAAFSLLVALAFRLPAPGFAVATWLLLAAVVIVALSCARRFHLAWVPSARAAVVIDHRAGLADRLATLAAAGAGERRSRLWTYLLHENLRLLPTWEPRHLVPRLTPRSVWFFAFALLLAVLSASRIPPPGSPARAAAGHPRAELDQPPSSADDEGSQTGATGGGAGSSTFWTDLPQVLQRAILGSGSSQRFAARIPERPLPLDRDQRAPATIGRRMESGGPSRSAPASPEVMSSAGLSKEGRGALPAPNSSRQGESAAQSNYRPARGDRPKALAAVPGLLRSPQSKSQPEHPTGTSGGGGSGAGGGGDKDGLFGERNTPAKASGSFALDLDAQRGSRPDEDGEKADPAFRPPVALSKDPRLDDAVRRAQIPAEYEKIVQRIFNRSADAGDRP